MSHIQHLRRLRAETRFRRCGQGALTIAVLILVVLVGSVVWRGIPGFIQTQVRLAVTFDPALLDLANGGGIAGVRPYSYQLLAQASLRKLFPGAAGHDAQRELDDLLSPNDGEVIKPVLEKTPSLLGNSAKVWIPASSNADLYIKGKISERTPEADRKLSDRQIAWINTLETQGSVRRVFDTGFFTKGDSRAPSAAGFLSAMIGSALTLVICLLVAFPLGVMTAVYLEEFARGNVLVRFIEVNINNLAAVPSIVFGLLGLAVYINLMGVPRSSPLVGGLTLAMMILPVIIIATRAAIASIPGSIRDAALALGATHVQVAWQHVLPLAMPGIMTGTILGLARAIGETAPLLMIGMVAFVADIPSGFTSPATVMPVQIYLWASSPEAGFAEKTAAGILVLIVLLLAMNALAIWLRRKFEVRW
ncbi:MAG: phosphate ABC transporter permease PstA [Pseudomonadota bacterium]|nr:phosphate ABC transporter permease PstA [Pseudomonadota bacterium]